MYELLFMTIILTETNETECLKGESFTRNEYPVKPETKHCASTISWSLKIASTGREAPCWRY